MKKPFVIFSLTLLFAAFVVSGCARKSTVISADGVSISYEVNGSGEPALVFVHGWCCDRTYWKEQVPHFARKHEVVLIDLAGHGESGLNRKAWTIAAFGGDVVAVVEKLGLDKVVLIGHSMGGSVILEAAQRMPNRVVGLVGVDTFNNVEEKFTQEQIDGFFSAFRANFAEAMSNFARYSFFMPNADSVFVEKIIARMSAVPPEVGLGAAEAQVNFTNNDLLQALRQIRAPVRCINSARIPTNVEAGKRYTSSFEVTLMPAVGHFVMMEDPATFNRLLDDTIKGFMGRHM